MRRHVPNPVRRLPHARVVLLAVVAAGAVTLALPRATPTGEVLDLTAAGTTSVVSGQEPTPAGSAAPASEAAPSAGSTAASASPATTPSPAVTPSPSPSPGPTPTPIVQPATDLTGYVWPIKHPRLTLPFGPTPWGDWLVNGKRFHDGVDLATFCGDRVVAAHAGTVLAAGRHFDTQLGWVGSLAAYTRRLDRNHLWSELPILVVIDDGNGYRSMYAHFGRIVVKRGQTVAAGQLLGYEGATGHATGCHLHYGLFSPWEQQTFLLRSEVVKRMKLPRAEQARIDPFLVLPPKAGLNAPRPKHTPSPQATATH